MIQNYFDNVKRILGSLISNAPAREGWGKSLHLLEATVRPLRGRGGYPNILLTSSLDQPAERSCWRISSLLIPLALASLT